MSQQEQNVDFVWIDRQTPLPNVCCNCGMYTDNRIKLYHSVTFQQVTRKQQSGSLLLSVILHLLLGPIALFLELFKNPDSDEDAVTETSEEAKRKIKLRIPQCALCAAVSIPSVIAANPNSDELMLKVHPRFKERMPIFEPQ